MVGVVGGTLVGPQSPGSHGGGPREGAEAFWFGNVSLQGWNFGAEVGEVRAEPFQGADRAGETHPSLGTKRIL